MKVVEIKQELNDTSFEQEIFDISKLSRHIISMLDIAEEINYNNYKYISSLTPKILKMLDIIDFILGKEMLEDVKYKAKLNEQKDYRGTKRNNNRY